MKARNFLLIAVALMTLSSAMAKALPEPDPVSYSPGNDTEAKKFIASEQVFVISATQDVAPDLMVYVAVSASEAITHLCATPVVLNDISLFYRAIHYDSGGEVGSLKPIKYISGENDSIAFINPWLRPKSRISPYPDKNLFCFS